MGRKERKHRKKKKYIYSIEDKKEWNFDIDRFYSIYDLYNDGDYEKALIYINKYLNIYPNDFKALHLYMRILISNGKIEEAVDCYNEYKDYFIKDNNYFDFLMCFFQKKYKEAYEILPTIEDLLVEKKQNTYNRRTTRYIELKLYLEHVLQIESNVELEEDEYKLRQIVSYDPTLALEHIFDRHTHYSLIQDKNKFEEEIDVERLFYDIKKRLAYSKLNYCSLVFDTYLFEYPKIDNIEYQDGLNYKYVYVLVIRDTYNIINMYPKFFSSPKKSINALYNEEIKEIPKVKKLSQIDKFNQRYGLKDE